MGHWSELLHNLPIPAALLEEDGVILTGNRWLDASNGEVLITPTVDSPVAMAMAAALHHPPAPESHNNAHLSPGLHYGVDGSSRWRLRQLGHHAGRNILVATRASDESGDHVLRRFFSAGPWLFVAYDQWGRIIEYNSAWTKLLGYSTEELFGMDSWTLLADESAGLRPKIEADLREVGRSEPAFKMLKKDGGELEVQWTLYYDTELGRSFGLGRDVTLERLLTDQLEHQATTDDLTGLPNRTRLLEQLEQWWSDGYRPTVFFCDLDHFKIVNDSLGHQAGDELLAELGRRLSTLVEEDKIMVGRMGGDEFVAIVKSATVSEAEALGQRIIDLVGQMFIVAGQPAHIGVSVGISLGARTQTISNADDNVRGKQHTPSRQAASVLDEADTAAYRAKQAGRNRISVYDAEMRATADRRLTVEVGLRQALEDDRIEARYQPIVNVTNRTIVGVESLIRWRQEDGRLAPPNDFLDVAQEAGLLPELGLRMLEKATSLGGRTAAAGKPLTISVNLSAVELSYSNLVERVRLALETSRLEPEHLLLEITETAVLRTEATLPVLWDLQSTGVRIGLDDFGTGFSSLAHLRELPIDVVKIDRSFVNSIVDDEVTRQLTASLVGLCDALALEVILEGVETIEQAEAVERLGGILAQGYLYHQPMSEAELLSLLELSPPAADGESAATASPRMT